MTEKRTPTPITAKWHGEKIYRCRLCAFDSTDRKKFEDHFAKMHPPFQVIDGGSDTPPDKPDKKEGD